MKFKIVIVVIIYLLTANPVRAKNPGEVGGQWLKMGIDARSVARGGAVTALTEDASSVYWNEAGLAKIKNSELNLTHLNRLSGIIYFNLAFAHSLNKGGTLGLNFFTLYTEAPVRDRVTGNITDEFKIYDSYFEILYGKKITGRLSAGGGVKGIYSQLGDYYESSNMALDSGIIYDFTDRIIGGISIQNISLNIKYNDNKESIPLITRAGLGYKFLNGEVEVDVEKPNDAPLNIHAGAEYILYDFLSCRVGYKYVTENTKLGDLYGLAGGLGIDYKKYSLDYAYTPYGNLGNTVHRYSFLINF